MKSLQELNTLAAALRRLSDHGWRDVAALVTIVGTQGSTFRRVGAAMLVHADGSVVNPLAGGCPQRDLVERAKEAMASGTLRRVAYGEENGFDLLMEAGCGGTLDVVVEPLASDADIGFLTALEGAIASRAAFRISTVFPPADADDRPWRQCRETPAGAAMAGAVAGTSCEVQADGSIMLTERFAAPLHLVLAGAGEEARQVAALAATLGWQGTVVDGSPDRLRAFEAPAGWTCREARPGERGACRLLTPGTAFLALTHNLEQDIAWLRTAADAGVFYLGALASRERARAVRAAVPVPALHVPAGLDIGSNTPAEIALAVLAEIMACREGREGRRLSAVPGPLHQRSAARA